MTAQAGSASPAAAKIAFVGCGYVFDIYMRSAWAYREFEVCGVYDRDGARLEIVARHYGLKAYPSLGALLEDPRVEIVVNLTSVDSHYEVTRAALEAGKHVYSEKPIATELDQTRDLFELAESRGLVLTGAPCNLHCDAIATMWKAVRDGAIGKPVLVYAELDDNPAHLMRLETVRSPTGAPFPYAEELQQGCTFEHVGYHLVWICAMFGPAVSAVAYSRALIANKTATPLSPPDTPDLSVACLDFESGVSARVTCSWVAPRNHQLRIVGDEGEIWADNVFHDQSAVYLERFTHAGLSARKVFTLRSHPWLARLFGSGGRRLPLVRQWKSHAVEADRGVSRSLKHKAIGWLRRREVYAQDKLLGIAEMARAMRAGRAQPTPPDFLIHLNELTLFIQRAGRRGAAASPATTFAPVAPAEDLAAQANHRLTYRPRLFERALAGLARQGHS